MYIFYISRLPLKIYKYFLDRGFANRQWRVSFPSAYISHFPAFHSEHRPLFIDTQPPQPSRPKSFRFETTWTCDPTFGAVINKVWNHGDSSHCLPLIMHKIKLTKLAIKEWNLKVFGHLQTAIREAKFQIESLQALPIVTPKPNIEPKLNLMNCSREKGFFGERKPKHNGWKKVMLTLTFSTYMLSFIGGTITSILFFMMYILNCLALMILAMLLSLSILTFMLVLVPLFRISSLQASQLSRIWLSLRFLPSLKFIRHYSQCQIIKVPARMA